jgi:hypothetical protein
MAAPAPAPDNALYRNPLVITKTNGVVEHAVFVRPDPSKPPEYLVHLSILPSGHATVIDPHEHPNYHPAHTPEEQGERVKRFLELGGASMLGHPNAPATADAEVARLKAKHKIADAPVQSSSEKAKVV